MKMKNESEAWEYLAKLWSKPQGSGTSILVEMDGFNIPGLCSSINHMWGNNYISGKTYFKMKKAIDSLDRPSHNLGYVWPLTMDGAKKRAEFCTSMAKKTKRKSRQSKGK